MACGIERNNWLFLYMHCASSTCVITRWYLNRSTFSYVPRLNTLVVRTDSHTYKSCMKFKTLLCRYDHLSPLEVLQDISILPTETKLTWVLQ